MKKLVKNTFYASTAVLLTSINSVNAAINSWETNVHNDIITEWSAADVIQTYIARGMTFLYLIAVVFGIWGWFNILTAAWDEEKVKKWKTILIQAMIWLVVIFLAGTIVNWLVNAIL